MKTQEADTDITVFPLQTGDKIDKAGKPGEVIQVSPNQDILIMWKDGSMTKEEPSKLKKVNESAFTQYMKRIGRI